MLFGLTNAPATFNIMMDKIFQEHQMFTGVFFDDILVFSKTLEGHKEHLKKVFEELKANKLFINGKKSEFSYKKYDILDILYPRKESNWVMISSKLSKSGQNHKIYMK